MTTFTDMMMKVIDGGRLDPIERGLMLQYVSEIDSNRQIVSSWQNINKKIHDEFIDFPIKPIFSKVFEADTSSLSLSIPSDYNHLLIFSDGRTTSSSPGGAIWIVEGVLNDDSGTNYTRQTVGGNVSTAFAGNDTSLDHFRLGYFYGDDAASGVSGSNIAFILNYNSNFNKRGMWLTGMNDYAIMGTSYWSNSSPIRKMSIACGNSIKTGSIISVYGIK